MTNERYHTAIRSILQSYVILEAAAMDILDTVALERAALQEVVERIPESNGIPTSGVYH